MPAQKTLAVAEPGHLAANAAQKNYRHSAVKRKTSPSAKYKKYVTLQTPLQGPSST